MNTRNLTFYCIMFGTLLSQNYPWSLKIARKITANEISTSNHLTERVIWDISPDLVFIKFEIASAMVISKLIKDNKGGVYQISRTVMCFLINLMFTDRNQTTKNATCKNVIIVHNAIPGKNYYTTEFISR